jgi:LPS-assembly lipoprotein
MNRFIARRLTILMLAFIIAACGFHMRGVANLAFTKLYMKGSASISKDLTSALKTNGVTIVKEPEEAEMMLDLMSDGVEKRILSLGGSGSVREFELFYRIKFRVRDASDELWGEEQIIESRRDFSYLDSELLAKSYEEAMLYEDMRRDATRELMRRLVAQKPKAKAEK